MRAATLALLVALSPAHAASPQPTDQMAADARVLFGRWATRGENQERLLSLLTGYFGQSFEARDSNSTIDYYIIRRDPKSSSITYWSLIGSTLK